MVFYYNNNQYIKIKKLTFRLHKSAGRSGGFITIKNKGGGNNINYKFINFKPIKKNFEIINLILNYQKNTQLALINYKINNLFNPFLLNYIIPYTGIYKGQYITFKNNNNNPGKISLLKFLDIRTKINLLEEFPSSNFKLIRVHDSYGRIINQYKKTTLILLPSKKLKYISNLCYARVGLIYKQLKLHYYKAGQLRNINWMPVVRGVAKNTCDHPMGGGIGKSKSNKIPRTPYGKIIKK